MDDAVTAHGVDTTWAGPTPGAPIVVETSGLSGTTLCDRYRLDRLIGTGGMAQVWSATDSVLGRQVAVKLLHPHLAQDEMFVRRFRQEAIAAARLSNPGIVGVYDTCSDGGHEAIVMELLDATTLRQQIDAYGPLDVETATRIGLRLLEALEAAHRVGLVHRDVKPSNILLCHDGRVKIADFGIAKADDQTELTREGSLLGTATYLAPEQLTGTDIDGRADLYSLGIVLYECVVGHVPFEGDTGAAVALARLHRAPIDPRRLRADIPPTFAAVLMKALEREPDQRFGSAAEFRAALLDSGVPAGPTILEPLPDSEDGEPTETTPSFGRSERRWLLPALFILLIATALTVAGLLIKDSNPFSGSDPTTTTTAAAGPAQLPIDSMVTFDPKGRGDPGENDQLASRAADGDASTAWRTESYDQANFFGSKKGVGLATVLRQPANLSKVTVTGSETGWSASVYVLPGAGVDGLDLSTVKPVAELKDVRGTATADLAGADGQTVLVWITNLGDPGDGGRHRVEISEVAVEGAPTG
ncbi:MAG: serine/threonine-protein kinase [Acidimicrobiales bacterium]